VEQEKGRKATHTAAAPSLMKYMSFTSRLKNGMHASVYTVGGGWDGRRTTERTGHTQSKMQAREGGALS